MTKTKIKRNPAAGKIAQAINVAAERPDFIGKVNHYSIYFKKKGYPPIYYGDILIRYSFVKFLNLLALRMIPYGFFFIP